MRFQTSPQLDDDDFSHPDIVAWYDAFFNTTSSHASYNDSDIEQVALLLQRCKPTACHAPRTYIVLRLSGHLDILERLLESGFSDGWFPVESSSLPEFLDPRIKADIVRLQQLVMTKSLDLENGRHCHFGANDPLPFQTIARLGAGGYGQVDKIESKVTFKQYALKTIQRRAAFGYKSKEATREFLMEICRMKDLNHRHLVQYVGSYTDKNNLGLVMAPVADCDFADFLERACVNTAMRPTIRTSFGCLATALSYLHDCQIKHRDIKPGNILVYNSNVLIADFGLSHDFLDTTSGVTPASPRYCAPEVAKYGERNWSQDVWSLGCVFLEMVAALHGNNMNWLDEFYNNVGTCETFFHENPDATELLIQQWEQTWNRDDRKPLAWIRHMLAVDRRARPTAADVVSYVTDGGECMSYCGSCCNPFSIGGDDRRDSIASLFDNLDLDLATRAKPISINMPRASPHQNESRTSKQDQKQVATPLDGVVIARNPAPDDISKTSTTENLPPQTSNTSQEAASNDSWKSFTFDRNLGIWTYGGGVSDSRSKGLQPSPGTVHRSQPRGFVYGYNGKDGWTEVESAEDLVRVLGGDQTAPKPSDSPSPQGEERLSTAHITAGHGRRAVTPESTSKSQLKVPQAGRASSMPLTPRGTTGEALRASQPSPQHKRMLTGEDKDSGQISNGDRSRLKLSQSADAKATLIRLRRVFGVPLSHSIEYASVTVRKVEWDPYYEPIDVDFKIPIVVAFCTRVLLKQGKKDTFLCHRTLQKQPQEPHEDIISIFDSPPRYGKHLMSEDEVFLPSTALGLLLDFLKSLPTGLLPDHAATGLLRLAETEDALSSTRVYEIVFFGMPKSTSNLLVYLLAFVNFIDGKWDNMARLETLFCPVLFDTQGEPAKAIRVFKFLVAYSFYYLSKKTTGDEYRLRKPRKGNLG